METVDHEFIKLTTEKSSLFNESSSKHYGLESDLSNNNAQSLVQPDQLLFIDSAVENYQSLVDNLAEPAEVIILDSQQSGIVQITEHLNRYDDLSSIHIVSHGDVGQLFLGNTELSQATLPQYADFLTGWGDSMEKDGDIVLYGCDVAADLAGESFVQDLSQYTQADILASDDITGNAELGGDWELEYAVGNVEANSIFNTEIEASYQNTFNLGAAGGASGSSITDLLSNFDRAFFSDFKIPNPISPGKTIPFVVDTPTFSFADGIFIPNFNDPNSGLSTFSGFGGKLDSIKDFQNITRFNDPEINSVGLGFTTNSLNFSYNTFDFSSVSMNGDRITFGFEPGTLDQSRISADEDVTFKFLEPNSKKVNFEKKTIDLGALSFDAETVTFTPSTVSFEFDTNSMNVDLSMFRSNANLYEYKLLDPSEFTIETFSASDYRAAQYAFNGDELFDDEFYTGQTIVPEGMNPFTDYVENGFQTGKNPHPLFDVAYYNFNNPDVAAQGVEPLYHFATIGHTEDHAARDPHPLFDTSYYNFNNPDVVKRGVNALYQYSTTGYAEDHANRDPHPLFDSSYYNQQNPDVVAARMPGLIHYVGTGYTEDHAPRDPNRIFDSSYYNQQNPDVVAARMPSLVHYVQHGWRESYRDDPENFNPNRNPNPFFNTADYFEIHEDVKIASYSTDNANPAQHMLEYGFSEGRITSKAFQNENVAKFEQEITADSRYFPIAQKEFNKLGADLRAKSDGTIELSQSEFDPFKPVEKLIYYVIGGIAVTAINIGEFLIDLADDVVWEIAFNAFDNGTEISGFSVAPDIPTGTPPFKLPESTRTVEIFVPGEIEGTENIFFTPLDDFILPANPTIQDGRDITQELIDGSIFIGGEIIPQGTYVYTSDNSGGFIGYDPTELSNSSGFDWNKTIEQRGQITADFKDTGVLINNPTTNITIPRRTPNELAGNDRDRTHGLQIDSNGNVVRLRSVRGRLGEVRPSHAIKTEQELVGSKNIRDIRISLGHPDGLAASSVRQLNLDGATVVINHETGPCEFCLTGIPEILRDGQTLDVVHTTDNGITWFVDTFTGGKVYNKNTDRKKLPIDF